jgi:hypothetical protein
MKLNSLYQPANFIYALLYKSKAIKALIAQLFLIIFCNTVCAKNITIIFKGQPLKLKSSSNIDEFHGEIDGKKVIATINDKVSSKAHHLGTFKKLKRDTDEKKLITYHVFEN